MSRRAHERRCTPETPGTNPVPGPSVGGMVPVTVSIWGSRRRSGHGPNSKTPSSVPPPHQTVQIREASSGRRYTCARKALLGTLGRWNQARSAQYEPSTRRGVSRFLQPRGTPGASSGGNLASFMRTGSISTRLHFLIASIRSDVNNLFGRSRLLLCRAA